jgi:transposase
MPKAYSDALRCNILQAHDRGDGSLRELAKRYSVSYEYVRKIYRQRQQTGQMQRVRQTYRTGRLAPLAKSALLERLGHRTYATLAHLQKDLANNSGIAISEPYLWQVLQKIGARKVKATPSVWRLQDSESRRSADRKNPSALSPARASFLDENYLLVARDQLAPMLERRPS